MAKNGGVKTLLFARPAIADTQEKPAVKVLRFSAATAGPAIIIAPNPLVGKTVSYRSGDTVVAGVVQDVVDGAARVKLALPNEDGVLLVTSSEVILPAAEVKQVEAVTREVSVKRWEHLEPFTIDSKMSEVKEGGKIVDYQDVVIEGFASTFKNTTPRDRDGDYVMPDAFNDTIQAFMRNPVMLTDHRNSVDNLAGSFEKISINQAGLAVRARVSNAPELRRVRFLIAEKHLKAFSMGGLFYFGGDDGHAIEKVVLWEVSLVAIPANQDCLFHTRAISLDDVKEAFTRQKTLNRSLLSGN